MGKKQTSKELLKDAILTLSERFPIDQISVKMLANESGVCIQTFYNHFTDKLDLVLWIHSSECRRLLDKLREKEMNLHEVILNYINYYLKHETFMRNAFNNTHGPESFAKKSALISAFLWGEYLREKTKTEELPSDILFELKMYSAAVSVMTARYLDNKEEASPEEFAQLLEDSIPDRLMTFVSKTA